MFTKESRCSLESCYIFCIMRKWLVVFIVFIAFAPVPAAQAADSAPTSVKVTQLPSVSVTRDCLDWLALFFSGGLVLVGIFGVIAANRTLKSIETQVEIANKTLIIQFRPKLVVRRIQLQPQTVAEFDASEGKEWEIAVHIINRGGTDAHIEMCDISAYWKGSYPDVIISKADQSKWGKFSISPGETENFILPVSNRKEFRKYLNTCEEAVANGKSQMLFPVCQGFISYLDGNGRPYDLAFDRHWRVDVERFIPADNPDSEYGE